MKTRNGWVVVDNIRYDYDVIVHPDRSVTKRSKKKSKKLKKKFGHIPLSGHELAFLKKEKPELLFIGTGQYGDLPITPDAYRILKQYTSTILPTPDVIELLEAESRQFVAILHVNC
ncbi:MAG: hypothetical protein STSR0009_05610 [Methanoregula sp.]